MVVEHTATQHRGDIQGLRALAVGLVVAWHTGVEQLAGGYIGVDVFFVISGFLITKLLLDEADRSGVISLKRFWARRVRRIVPMSLLVVVVTVIASLFMLEDGRLRELTAVSLGAIGFSANIVLYFTKGEYLSGVTLPSPLQHYWSLAVEEQFYLAWPLILLVVIKVGRTHWKIWFGCLVAIMGVASLVVSVTITGANPSGGYYLPHARVWEILAGAGLAMLGTHVLRISVLWRTFIGWTGLLLILWSAIFLDSESVFPGSLALVPVLGTVAVLVAVGTTWGPQRILGIAPAQRIGAWSYSIYLWHWPILVLVEARFGTPSGWMKLGLMVMCVALSAASYSLVEQPLRSHAWLVSLPWRSLTAGAAAVSVALAAVTILFSIAPRLDADSQGLAIPDGLSSTLTATDLFAGQERRAPVPESTIPARTEVNILLLGDSTLAVLRWYKQGTVALKGFNYQLDAESCRRIALRSCLGREKRVPVSAVRTLELYEGPLDYVVLMAGYHSSTDQFAKEFKLIADAVRAKQTKLVFLTLKESLKFPAPGSRGKRSVYADFNKILRDQVVAGGYDDVIVADWDFFSYYNPQWFDSDDIHLNIVGTVALGWFISNVVASVSDNPCPFEETYPCVVPRYADPKIDWLKEFGVESTNVHCYEDGTKRKITCTKDRRP